MLGLVGGGPKGGLFEKGALQSSRTLLYHITMSLEWLLLGGCFRVWGGPDRRQAGQGTELTVTHIQLFIIISCYAKARVLGAWEGALRKAEAIVSDLSAYLSALYFVCCFVCILCGVQSLLEGLP